MCTMKFDNYCLVSMFKEPKNVEIQSIKMQDLFSSSSKDDSVRYLNFNANM